MMYADVACLVQMTRDIEKFYGKLVGASRAPTARVATLGRMWPELSNAPAGTDKPRAIANVPGRD